MSYLRHLLACNKRDMSAYDAFYIGKDRVGWVRRDNVRRLREFSSVFDFAEGAIRLSPRLTTVEARTRAVAEVVETLAEQGFIRKMRCELYRVCTAWGATALMLLDRGAVPFFGVRAYGIHLNGLVGSGMDMKMWIGRRAPDKTVAPGKLDNVVAGGQPAGISLRQNLYKESWEEAGFSQHLMREARSTGVIGYQMETPFGLRCDTLFTYDIEIPDSVTPRCIDGEMSEFMLWPVERVLQVVRETDDFKFNVALVLIHFALRHGYIDPDLEPDYPALIAGLHPAPFG